MNYRLFNKIKWGYLIFNVEIIFIVSYGMEWSDKIL